MKKSFILASLLAFTISTSMANAQVPCPSQKMENCPFKVEGRRMPPPQNFKERQKAFDEKLQLTDEQKTKAKEIRINGHKKMKPIMEQIKTKKNEIHTIKTSEGTEEEKILQIKKINEEIKMLKKEAHSLRIKNMQEFESILTDKQKKKMEKMKKEGRKNFKKHRPKCPPCKCNCNCNK